MSLKKYLLIVLSVFMQFMPIDAKNDNMKYLLLTAGILTVSGLVYCYQDSLASMAMQLFGDTINEKGQVVITSQKAIEIMNKNQSLQNVSYGLRGPVVMEGGKIKSGTLIDGSYFTANDVNYVVKN